MKLAQRAKELQARVFGGVTSSDTLPGAKQETLVHEIQLWLCNQDIGRPVRWEYNCETRTFMAHDSWPVYCEGPFDVLKFQCSYEFNPRAEFWQDEISRICREVKAIEKKVSLEYTLCPVKESP